MFNEVLNFDENLKHYRCIILIPLTKKKLNRHTDEVHAIIGLACMLAFYSML